MIKNELGEAKFHRWVQCNGSISIKQLMSIYGIDFGQEIIIYPEKREDKREWIIKFTEKMKPKSQKLKGRH